MKKLTKVGFLLSLLVALFVTQVSAASFKDINNHWAKSTIQWASSKGIAKGYEDGTFKPNNSVTEAEFLALLIRSYEPSNFNYITNKHWADSYYAFAKEMNYPNEGQNNTTKRNAKITREHVAEILAGTQGVNYQGRDAIQYLLGKGLAKGKGNVVSIDGYGGKDTLTRAESVQFIKNVLEQGMKDENGKPIIQPRPTEPSPKDELPKLPSEPLGEVKMISVSDMMKAVNADMKKLGLTANPESAKTSAVAYRGTGNNRVTYTDDHGMIHFGIGEVNDTNMKGLEIMMKQTGLTLNNDLIAIIHSVKETKTPGRYETDKVGMSIHENNGAITLRVAKKQ